MSRDYRAAGVTTRLLVGLLIAAFGFALLLQNIGVIDVDVWRWWPIAIIAFGILTVSRAFTAPPPPSPTQTGVVFGGGSAPPVPPAAMRPGVLEPKMSEFAFWSGIERRVSSPAFARADLTAIMGGIEFDLRQAGTDNGEAVIEVFVLWGGIEIIVPPDWAVSNQVTAIMGGAEDQSTGTQAARHRLTVKGFVLMGGVDIKT